jgi:hypothetical protein
MAERKVQVPWMGKTMDGVEVPVEESTERWSEIKLEDGTIIRVKQSVAQVIRVDGQYDAEGNPLYVVKSSPAVAIVHVDEDRRRRVN